MTQPGWRERWRRAPVEARLLPLVVLPFVLLAAFGLYMAVRYLVLAPVVEQEAGTPQPTLPESQPTPAGILPRTAPQKETADGHQ